MDELTLAVKVLLDGVHSQREEILKAFVAKYGCEPDECEQVIISDRENIIRWFVQKKPLKEDL